MNDLENKSIECLKNMPIEETTYQVARNVVLDYITNLQEINNNLKEDFKRHIDRINELQERIEKAIRLIEEYHYFVFTKDIETIYKNANKEFINILKGKDNE